MSSALSFRLNAIIEISSISEIIINEIVHPRYSTMLIGLVAILILFAGVQSRINRRKWALQMSYLEMLSETENNSTDTTETSEIPAPVLVTEDNRIDRYDDEDIELI